MKRAGNGGDCTWLDAGALDESASLAPVVGVVLAAVGDDRRGAAATWRFSPMS